MKSETQIFAFLSLSWKCMTGKTQKFPLSVHFSEWVQSTLGVNLGVPNAFQKGDESANAETTNNEDCLYWSNKSHN